MRRAEQDHNGAIDPGRPDSARQDFGRPDFGKPDFGGTNGHVPPEGSPQDLGARGPGSGLQMWRPGLGLSASATMPRTAAAAAAPVLPAAFPSGVGSETPQAMAQGAAPEAPVDFMAVFGVMRRRRRLILAVAAGLIALSAPFILMMERVYFAELRLLLHRSPTSELAAPGTEPLGTLNLTTELERLLAQANVLQVITDLDLAARPEFQAAQAQVAQARTGAETLDGVVAKFYEGLRIRRDGQTNVVQIGFRSADPELAARIPNALVGVYLTRREEMLQTQVREAKGWMDEQIQSERRQIAEMEAAQTTYRVAHGPLSPEFQMATVYQISALEGRQFAIGQSRSDLESRISRLQAGRMGTDRLQEGSLAASLQRDLQAAKRDLARLTAVYGDRHETVTAAQGVVAEAEAAIAREIEAQLATARSDLAALDAETGAINAQLSAQRDSLSRMGIAQAEIAVMQHGIEARRDKLQLLEDQRRTLATGASLPVAEVEILSPSSIPSGPVGYGRKVYLALAVAAAFGMALTLACGLELMDRSIRSQQQLRGMIGIRTAGLIPHLPPQRGQGLISQLSRAEDSAFGDAIGWLMLLLRQGQGRETGAAARNGPGQDPAGGMSGEMSAATAGGSGSGFAEEARAAPHTAPGGILVASGMPKEGKSFLSAALAVGFQAAGQPVLLVDCDLRLGRIHTLFDTDEGQHEAERGKAAHVPNQSPGLGEVLAGRHSAAEVVRIDPATGIAYIPRGHREAQCDWTRMADVAGLAARTGRLLILDAAPILASGETVRLCRFAARTLLVTRWGRTSRRALELTLDRLRVEAPGEILVTINNVDPVLHSQYRFEDSDLFAPALSPYHTPAKPERSQIRTPGRIPGRNRPAA